MRSSWSVSFAYSLALFASMMITVATPSSSLAQASADDQAAYLRALQQYMRHGADMATMPARGPGSEYYRNGANALTVPSGNDPAANLFRRGADAMTVSDDLMHNGARTTSVPTGKEPGADYYRNGASVTKVPGKGEPGADYYSNGASATKVPGKGEPGYEYYSNGATATSLNAATSARRYQQQPEAPPAKEQEEEKAEPAEPEQPAEPAPAPAAKDSAEAQNKAAPQAAAAAANSEEQAPPDSMPEAAPSVQLPRATGATVAPLPEDKGEHAAVPPVPVAPDAAITTAEPSALAHLVDRYAGGVRLFAAAFIAAIGVLALGAIWLVRRAKRSAEDDSASG